MALFFQKAPPRQRADFRAAEALEQLHAPLEVGAAGGFGADQDQPGRVGRMARGVGQRDHAAERGAQHDRIDDAQRLAERVHVVAPLRQIPALPRAVLAAAVAAMVEIDDLGDVGQSRIGRPVDRVVEAGPAMSISSTGFSRITGPSGTNFAPSTSKNSRTPFTDTCMAWSPLV